MLNLGLDVVTTAAILFIVSSGLLMLFAVMQIITLIFGRGVQMVASPVSGAIPVLGGQYSAYRLILVGVALLVALALGWLLNGTRLGLQTRAVIMNEALARVLGISSSRVRFITFCTGAALAAAAGCLSTPPSSGDPRMGVPWAVGAFMLGLVSRSSLVSLAVARVPLARVPGVAST